MDTLRQNIISEKSYEELFNLWFEDLMRFVCSYVRDEEIAKDTVHDVFYTIWRNREKLDISKSMKSYLFTLARNYALNYLRHRKVTLANEQWLASNMKNIQEELDDYELRMARLDRKLKELSQKQHELLELCFVKGITYKEAADELHITVNTVKTHIQRALRFLRAELNEDLILIFLLPKNV